MYVQCACSIFRRRHAIQHTVCVWSSVLRAAEGKRKPAAFVPLIIRTMYSRTAKAFKGDGTAKLSSESQEGRQSSVGGDVSLGQSRVR